MTLSNTKDEVYNHMVEQLEHEQSHCSRRAFLSAALAAPVIVAGLPATFSANNVKVSSFPIIPGGYASAEA